MLGPLTLLLLLLPVLASIAGTAETRWTPPDADPARERLIMEAVKTGILSSLGLEREPRPSQRATEGELRAMHLLYKETLRQMRRNSSQPEWGHQDSSASTVLFPVTVEALKVGREADSRRGQRVQWYRAVFRKNPNIRAEVTLARAELKISRQVLSKPTSAQPEVRVKVKIEHMKPVNLAAQAPPRAPANVSKTREVSLDVGAKVAKWMRAKGRKQLVVDVGLSVGGRDPLGPNPDISLELGLTRRGAASARTRVSRSNKEDECNEQGWCCRKSLVVSFKDIGWSDWVVAPVQYTMHLCDGTCPHNYKPASMHTQVKSRLHQMMKGGTPRPCCVPAAYEPMILMHYDSRGKLKLTPFEDLIVTKCHCA